MSQPATEKKWSDLYYSIRRDRNNSSFSSKKHHASADETGEKITKAHMTLSLASIAASSLGAVATQHQSPNIRSAGFCSLFLAVGLSLSIGFRNSLFLAPEYYQRPTIHRKAGIRYKQLSRAYDELLRSSYFDPKKTLEDVSCSADNLQQRKHQLDAEYKAYNPSPEIHTRLKQKVQGPPPPPTEAPEAAETFLARWTEAHREREREAARQAARDRIGHTSSS